MRPFTGPAMQLADILLSGEIPQPTQGKLILILLVPQCVGGWVDRNTRQIARDRCGAVSRHSTRPVSRARLSPRRPHHRCHATQARSEAGWGRSAVWHGPMILRAGGGYSVYSPLFRSVWNIFPKLARVCCYLRTVVKLGPTIRC